MINAPCKDCKDRAVNCHSNCQKYIEFKKQKEASNVVKRREVELRAYDIECSYRRKSRGSSK